MNEGHIINVATFTHCSSVVDGSAVKLSALYILSKHIYSAIFKRSKETRN